MKRYMSLSSPLYVVHVQKREKKKKESVNQLPYATRRRAVVINTVPLILRLTSCDIGDINM